MINPFKILVNRIRCFFGSIGFFKKQRRIKTHFEIGEYHFYVDMICGVPKMYHGQPHHSMPLDLAEDYVKSAIERQIIKVEKSYPHLDNYFNYISEKDDQESLKRGLEILISDLSGVIIYVNKLEVKSKADIRDEIINKVLR